MQKELRPQLFFFVNRSFEENAYRAPLRRLHSLQSIWQFSVTVLPPSRHGVMWSPSINSKSNSLPQIGQMWLCRSHTASFISSGKLRRSKWRAEICSAKETTHHKRISPGLNVQILGIAFIGIVTFAFWVSQYNYHIRILRRWFSPLPQTP